MSGFGEKFRTARELRGIDFSKITQQTRISARFLRAIENEAFEELPGGLFNRGFVRTYAEAVGLDPNTMVEEYTALTRKAEPQETETPPPTPTLASRERYILPVAAGGLLVLALILYASWRGSGSQEITPASSVTTTPSLAATNVEPAPETADGHDDIPNSEGILVAETLAARETAETEAEAEATLTVPTPIVARTEEAEEPAPVAPETVRGTSIATAAASARVPPVTVRVELHDSSWMYIELDGEIQYEKNINPPFWRNYTVTDALQLKIGNPAAAALSVNGEPVSSPAVPPDEIWSLTITPENASSLTGSL